MDRAERAVHRRRPFEYPAGTWVVGLDQPFRAFAKDLFEAQRLSRLALESRAASRFRPTTRPAGRSPTQMGVAGRVRWRGRSTRLGWCSSIPRADGTAVKSMPRVARTHGATSSIPRPTSTAIAVNRLLASGRAGREAKPTLLQPTSGRPPLQPGAWSGHSAGRHRAKDWCARVGRDRSVFGHGPSTAHRRNRPGAHTRPPGSAYIRAGWRTWTRAGRDGSSRNTSSPIRR